MTLNHYSDQTINVNDILSGPRGTGTRYNAGKASTELLPLYIVVQTLDPGDDMHKKRAYIALNGLAEFQRTRDPLHLTAALTELSVNWTDCAKVFGYGAQKYASWNWIKGMNWSIPLACAVRHCLAMFHGVILDHESGLPHIGHVMCNLVMLRLFCDTYPEGNDLPPIGFIVE